MSAPPTGTVTFLFTDLEGSTRLLGGHPETYARAVARHHDLLERAVRARTGVVFETVGDAVYAAFARPTDAVAAAAHARGRDAAAVRLCAAAAALRGTAGERDPSSFRELTEQVITELREALGEERFAAAWAEGRALSLDAAVALALEQTAGPPGDVSSC